MTGISEILVLVLLIACILILPRLFKGESSNKKITTSTEIKKLTVIARFGIVLSFIYPLVLALLLKPWEKNNILYISVGIIPVFIIWAIVWIMAGRKK
ncbi:MAG: hypothetical protein GY699_09960 [Desulfobacteraceae bacterium]|nr:hypothetical protein [Desulfobacteraceae bacterium]